MTIAEEIYVKAQQLPEDVAKEVLDFIGYLELKYGRRFSPRDPVLPTAMKPTHGSLESEIWSDLLFGKGGLG